MSNNALMEDIYWVCVLYNSRPIQPSILNSLENIFSIHTNYIHNIVVYDNSQKPIDFRPLNLSNVHVSFKHNPANPGLAVAYNYALKKAIELKKKWLVLLDQDSILESNFLEQLTNSIEKAEKDNSVVAIIPRVYHNKILVSPSKLFFSVLNLPYKSSGDKVIDSKITAINSGSVLLIDFLISIGGFNEEFPLDILDHWLYYEIFQNKKNVFLTSSNIKHSLSVTQAPITIDRYKSGLLGEKKLYCDIKRKKINYSLLLIFRTCKQILKGRFTLAKMTITFLYKCYAN